MSLTERKNVAGFSLKIFICQPNTHHYIKRPKSIFFLRSWIHKVEIEKVEKRSKKNASKIAFRGHSNNMWHFFDSHWVSRKFLNNPLQYLLNLYLLSLGLLEFQPFWMISVCCQFYQRFISSFYTQIPKSFFNNILTFLFHS